MLLLLAALAPAQDAFVGARILVGDGTVYDPGTLVIADGHVTAVGPAPTVSIPAGATRHDASGKVLIPGLVDTHSHIGATRDLNEMSGPFQPDLSAIDAIDAGHPSLQLAQAGGITTANIMPGSGNLMGGQTAYVKLRDVVTVDGLLLCDDRRDDVCGGMKMANGTNPQGDGTYPRTRMASAARQRQALQEGRGKGGKKRRGTPKDPVAQILSGDRIVHFHTHRADDIVTAILMAEEFGFTLVLHHVSEAWKVAGVIAEHAVPCSLIVIDSPGGKEEAVEIRAENAAALEALGVPVALHTDDPITDSRLFLRSGALAVRAGMSEAGALRALTIEGAKMLGLEDRIGTLEAGKDADLVVLSGDPFSVWTQVEQTWVDGVRVFDRNDPNDRRLATGGWDAGDRHPVTP